MTRRQWLGFVPAATAVSGFKQAPPRTARLRPALCAYTFRQALQAGAMSYQDLVRYAVEHDLDGLDLTVYWFPAPLTESWLADLKRVAYRNGIEIYSISVRTEMTRPTAEARRKEVEEIRRWVEVASLLGAGHMRVFGGRVPEGASQEQAAGWAAEVLAQGAEYAGRKGVILGLENHGGITERAETIVRIVRQVNSPWAGINLDTGNFASDVWRQIEICLPYTVNVQLKSHMRDESGRVVESDWDRIFAMIARSGYRGYLALEYEAKEPPETAVPRLLKRLRELAAKYSG
ncbi:MAG: sugar phosphate isomerase/epimerase family protein [Bryobacterales bacterium]|nr:sugar phosphate isomerase/epimerase family protein [Bryobacterales bacterium]